MTSVDLELGPKPAPRKSLTNQSAWIESEIHEINTISSGGSVPSTPGSYSSRTKGKELYLFQKPKERKRKQREVSDHESVISGSVSGMSGDIKKEGGMLHSKTDSSSDESIGDHTAEKKLEPQSKTKFEKNEERPSLEETDWVPRDILSLGSRRLSAGDTSLDESHSVTSQSYSEIRSYRDRIRDRFHSVKERVGHSVSGPKFRFQRDHVISRFDDMLRKEEVELNAALEKRDVDRYKRKESTLLEQDVDLSASYDFFTRTWDEGTETVTRSAEIRAVPSAADDADLRSDDSGQDSSKLLALDYLGLTQEEWDLVDRKGSSLKWDLKKLAAKQAELLFVPSTEPVPLENKLPPGQSVRYPEEEGLFVGERPRERVSNLNKFEHRIAAQGDIHWFGDDGELKTIRDPIQYPFLHPIMPKDLGEPSDLVKYVPPIITDIADKIMDTETGRQVLLELHLDNLHFRHHPLFSREHVIAGSLCDLFNQYQQRKALNKQDRLAKRLQSLRAAYDSAKNITEDNDSTDQRWQLKKYSAEIRETRKQWLAESLIDRQLAASLLSHWRDLKRLRISQGYNATPCKLVIHCARPRSAQKEKEIVEWEEEVRRTVSEVEEELKKEFDTQTAEYERKLQVWREKQLTRNAKKKAPSRRSNSSQEESIQSGEELKKPSEEKQESIETVSREDTEDSDSNSEPVPPPKLDLYEAKRQTTETIKNSLRPPGEPRLTFSMVETLTVDESPNVMEERQRCAAVKRCEFFIRVFYNDKEVCRTDRRPISDRFVVTFNERFSIKLRQPPFSIKLLLIESGAGASRHLLAELFIPIPSGSAAFDSSEIERLDFSSPRAVTFRHAGIGSGPPGDPELGCLYTSGTLHYNIGWGRHPEDHYLLAPRIKYLPPEDSYIHSNDLIASKGTRGVLDAENLADWASMAQLDPNDPANASFFYFIKNARSGGLHGPSRYMLKSPDGDFYFCDDEYINNNLRFKLLKLRDQGEQEFKDMRFVPNRDKEITKDAFTAYERRISAAAREAEYESDNSLDDHFTSVRTWGRQYLHRVQQQVLARYKQAKANAELHHFISEDQVPDISTLGLTFVKWLRPKRPLRPERRERKRVAVGSLAGQEVRLVLSVVRAFEVPVRRDADLLGGSVVAGASSTPLPTPVSPTEALGFSTIPVRPFVEVSYQGISTRTTAAEGANPTWNQDLILPVRPGGEDNNIFIHIFDEVLEDLMEDDRLRDTTIHQRITRHWLAGLTVPFTTLVHNSQLEGTFKLYSPPVLLGYERETHLRPTWGMTSTQTALSSSQLPNQQFPRRDATFLTVYITVQPALLPPEVFKERLESSEVAPLEQHLYEWQQKAENNFPNRPIRPLVTDVSGKTVCVTRFFRPLTPPVLVSKSKGLGLTREKKTEPLDVFT